MQNLGQLIRLVLITICPDLSLTVPLVITMSLKSEGFFVFYVVQLSWFDGIIRGLKTLGNSLVDLFKMLWDFCTHILDFLNFLLEGVADTLSILLNCLSFMNYVSVYIPPFAQVFFILFVAGITIRVILQVV